MKLIGQHTGERFSLYRFHWRGRKKLTDKENMSLDLWGCIWVFWYVGITSLKGFTPWPSRQESGLYFHFKSSIRAAFAFLKCLANGALCMTGNCTNRDGSSFQCKGNHNTFVVSCEKIFKCSFPSCPTLLPPCVAHLHQSVSSQSVEYDGICKASVLPPSISDLLCGRNSIKTLISCLAAWDNADEKGFCTSCCALLSMLFGTIIWFQGIPQQAGWRNSANQNRCVLLLEL